MTIRELAAMSGFKYVKHEPFHKKRVEGPGGLVCGSTEFKQAARNGKHVLPLTMNCPTGKTIKSVGFADWGKPSGTCGKFIVDGDCTSRNTTEPWVEKMCIGHNKCVLDPVHGSEHLVDSCPGIHKALIVQVRVIVIRSVCGVMWCGVMWCGVV